MKIGIIGAGTMGLTLGYRLGQAGHQITILEAEPQVGGLSTWSAVGDIVWDKYYHVICKTDANVLGLLADLGIGDQIQWRQTRTGFLWNGRHISMSNNHEFITFPALNIWDKVRLAWGILRCCRTEYSLNLENTRAIEWLIDYFGKKVYEAVWEPLLESKYGAVKEELPATIIWATIRRYYGSRNKTDGSEQFGFLQGGMKTLIQALARAIEQQGGQVICATAVTDVKSEPSGASCIGPDGTAYEFDWLISTIPSARFHQIAPNIELHPSHHPSHALGVVCLSMLLRRSLSRFYITNLIQRGFPFTGIIEVTNLIGPETIGGQHLVMLPRYDIPTSDWFNHPPQEVETVFLDALEEVFPDIRQNIIRTALHRDRYIQTLWIDEPPPAEIEPGRSPEKTVWSVNGELTGRDTLNNNGIIGVANRMSTYLLDAMPVGASQDSNSIAAL